MTIIDHFTKAPRGRSAASIVAQAAATVPKPPELARIEAELAKHRDLLAELRAENGRLYGTLTDSKIGGTRDEATIERKMRDLKPKVAAAEESIRSARRRRAQLMPDYAAALTEALSAPTGEAARRILDLMPELRAALDVIREAATVTAPVFIAEMGLNARYAGLAGINLAPLAEIENLALLLAPPPAVEAVE